MTRQAESPGAGVFVRVQEKVKESRDGGYVAMCPELGVGSQGETIDEALSNLRDAIVTFLNTITELGDWQAFFKERGIELLRREPKGQTTVNVAPGEIVSTYVAAVGRLIAV